MFVALPHKFLCIKSNWHKMLFTLKHKIQYDLRYQMRNIRKKTEQTPKHSENRHRALQTKSWDPLQIRVPFVHTFGGLVLCLCAIEFPFDYNICAVFGWLVCCSSVCVHRFEQTLFRNVNVSGEKAILVFHLRAFSSVHRQTFNEIDVILFVFHYEI